MDTISLLGLGIPTLGGFLLGAAVVYAFKVVPVRKQLAVLRDERDRIEIERVRLEERLAAEERSQSKRQVELAELESNIQARFAALAREALGRNSEDFLRLVSERFELHRQEAENRLSSYGDAIDAMLRPIAESLARFEQRVAELEKAREGAYRALVEQARQLAEGQQLLYGETRRLVEALRRPKTRGRWGEFQLQNALELAGLSEHVDYVRESGVATAGSSLRPDVILRLPGGRALAVDAKTPLDAYIDAIEAVDETARSEALLRHARQLRAHARALGGKEYWRALQQDLRCTPDFVVMFIPGEAFFAAAIERDPALLEDALAHRVLIATPTTFIALVKAIAYGWQQEKLAENANRVASLARELHGRMSRFVQHFERLGQSLQEAVERFNESVASLEGRVVPTLRKFETYAGIAESERLALPRSLDARTRSVSSLAAPEGEDGG